MNTIGRTIIDCEFRHGELCRVGHAVHTLRGVQNFDILNPGLVQSEKWFQDRGTYGICTRNLNPTERQSMNCHTVNFRDAYFIIGAGLVEPEPPFPSCFLVN